MRVLYVAHLFWPYIGGLETISATLLAGLHERGFEFSVLTCREDPRLPVTETWTGRATVHRLELTQALTLRDAAQLGTIRHEAAALAREYEPDLVHVAFSPQAGYLALGARLERLAPLVVSFHGFWPVLGHEGPTLTRRLLDAADWVTGCSQATLEDVRAFEPGIAERSSSIPNGMDADGTAVAPPPGGPPLVLGIGRLSPEKGFDVLLRAFARVRETAPDARLVLAGRGLEEGALTALAGELGIADAVEFRGWVRSGDVPALIDRASVVAVPSREEGFGMTALEAALRARPVVASRTGGLPEVVEDGVTGVLVAPEEDGELAVAIGELIEDRERAARLGLAARERAQRLFSRDRLLDEHAELYGRLAAQPAPAAPLSSPP